MKILETNRLILRGWETNDLDDFYEYAKVEGVGEMAGWQHHTNKATTQQILKTFIDSKEVYAIVLKENEKVIGSIGIQKNRMEKENKNVSEKELGYVLSKNYWGQGIMSEAVEETIKYIFEDLKIDILWCSHYSFNEASYKIIKKMGFKFYENRKVQVELLNKTYDRLSYKMTKTDYKNIKKELI